MSSCSPFRLRSSLKMFVSWVPFVLVASLLLSLNDPRLEVLKGPRMFSLFGLGLLVFCFIVGVSKPLKISLLNCGGYFC